MNIIRDNMVKTYESKVIPGEILEIVEKYAKLVEQFEECNDRFFKADQHFSSWTGSAREKLQLKLKGEIPAFKAIAADVRSYGDKAKESADNTIALEREISGMLG